MAQRLMSELGEVCDFAVKYIIVSDYKLQKAKLQTSLS